MSAKDVGVRIRVERELREAFLGACIAENRHASDVLREFMRSFAERHGDGKQISLIADSPRRVGKQVAAKRRSTKK